MGKRCFQLYVPYPLRGSPSVAGCFLMEDYPPRITSRSCSTYFFTWLRSMIASLSLVWIPLSFSTNISINNCSTCNFPKHKCSLKFYVFWHNVSQGMLLSITSLIRQYKMFSMCNRNLKQNWLFKICCK